MFAVFGPTDTDRFLWAQAWDDPASGDHQNRAWAASSS
jgi:hypothetical protein